MRGGEGESDHLPKPESGDGTQAHKHFRDGKRAGDGQGKPLENAVGGLQAYAGHGAEHKKQML